MTSVAQVKASVKTQGGDGEDPDSRMDTEKADRRDKKGGKSKVEMSVFLLLMPLKQGLRGSSSKGSFWKQ